MMKAIGIAAVASFGTIAAAQTNQQCQGDVCFQLNIPSTNSGTGDIFFQLSAPTSYEWVGLGQGSSMSGSNMFIMYQSADGSNVTVSPRLGTGHEQPQHDTATEITLLGGSGVTGGKMVANVRCGNCDSWSGGSMDFSSSSGSWMYAVNSGTPLQSDDLSESISQHGNSYGSFDFDFSAARGGSSVNPFLNSDGSTSAAATTCTPAPSQTLASVSGSGCPTAWPTEFSTAWPTARPTWAASCFADGGPSSWPTNAPWRDNDKRQADACESGSSGSDSSSSDSANLSESGLSRTARREVTMQLAHGAMASLAFVALFPTGGILIRIASFTGLIWVHAALQIVAYIFYIIAFAMGVWIAANGGYLTQAHPIIGIVLLIVLFLQPLSGMLHHKLFKKYNGRTTWSYMHIGVGRMAIILGIINGGLGLQLAGDTATGHVVAYAVCAAVFGLAYIAAIIYGERRRKMRALSIYQENQKIRGHGPPSDSYSIGDDQTGYGRDVQMHSYYAKRDRA